MESLTSSLEEAPITPRTVYAIYTRVVTVTSEDEVISTRIGTGKGETVQEKVNLGWFVRFEGSWEKLFFGRQKPPLDPGDMVKITFEKVIQNG